MNIAELRRPGHAILSQIAKRHGWAVSDICGRAVGRFFARARQEAYYRLYSECGHLNMESIGRLVGGRDPSTVHHGICEHARRNGLAVPKREVGVV